MWDTGLPVLRSLSKTVFASLKNAGQWVHAAIALAEKRCPACHAPFSPWQGTGCHPEEALVCPDCARQLKPYAGARCPLCGLPYADPASPSVPCGQCIASPPPWAYLAFHGLYSNLLQALLLRLKYHADFSLVPLLGTLLSQVYASMPSCQIAVAVPQHPDHLRERGFNQAHELARRLAGATGLQLTPHALCRTRPTLPQTQLNAQERKDNPKNSFAAHNVAGAHVLLIDDTMTTGSTLHHASLALLAGGAATVMVAVVARTPR